MIQPPIYLAQAVIFVSILCSFSAAASCSQNGWFGSSSCLYLCHCAGGAHCNKLTGSCPQGCEAGWFGQACQYQSADFTVTSPANTDVSWLTDGLDDTCNDGTEETITVFLNIPRPLTWVRLVVSEEGLLDQLFLTYQDSSGTTGLEPCAQERRAKVDERTLDISCPTERAAVFVNLHGEGVKALCSWHISGGRNVALKQSTQQSSTFDGFVARNAVDGNPGVPGSNHAQFRQTCTHTHSSSSIGWWTVTFSHAVKINSFVIYNRRRDNPDFIDFGCCESRLRGFTLEAFPEGNIDAAYTFTDPAPNAKQIYTVVPQTAIDVDIDSVKITKRSDSPILTLCEVLLFGELPCQAGTFGLECDKQCNCVDEQDVCFVSTGGCPSGCASGYTGEGCDTICPLETYGLECAKNCSVYCTNSKECEPESGHCIGGCLPGYFPPLCNDACPRTTYGQDCLQNCSSSCVDSDCDHVTGACGKCYPGFVGDICDQKCLTYTFGVDCKENCSALCLDQLCDHVTGACNNCTDDRQGQFCEIVITEPPPIDVSSLGAGGQGDADSDEDGGGGVIGAVVGAVVGLAVVATVILVILWRKRRKSHKEELQSGQGVSNQLEQDNNISSIVITTPGSSSTEDPADQEETEKGTPIAKRVEDIPESVYSNVLSGDTSIDVRDLKEFLLKQDTESVLMTQFQSVPLTNSYSQSLGLSSQNAKKNRYKNIVPYDHSRVVLLSDPDKKWEDYINASYVKGYNGTDSFIAAQAPNNLILNDFVRMLWEKQVDKIVMLTNLVEMRKIKCTQYWPVDGDQMFGEIRITLLTTKVFAEYTIRQLRLYRKGEKARTLSQFHFTAWPDKSVPASPWGLVDLHQRVMAAPGSGPLLVHCSAGVGRTGTFIALCHLLQESEETGKMDFLSTLWRLRQDRMSMIQTVEQYQFLHRAALIGHTVSGSSIPVTDLVSRLSTLEGQDGAGLGLTREFEAVTSASEGEDTQRAMSKAEETEDVYQNSRAALNKQKNRLSNILPKDTYRPVLESDDKSLGTYINAVLVPTLTKDRQDILTQLPLPTTVTDFWRLVTQYNVSLVVAFETDSRHTDETIGEFLPQNDAGPMQDALFQIETTANKEYCFWQELSVSVCKAKKTLLGNKSDQHHVQFILARETRPDPETVLEYLRKIRSCRPEGKTRTLYMCRNGADHSGLMCVGSILLDMLETDQRVSVPIVVGTIKAIRPQVIPTVKQYKCLYETLKLALDTTNVYGNVGCTMSSTLEEQDNSSQPVPNSQGPPALSEHRLQESKNLISSNPVSADSKAVDSNSAPKPKPRMSRKGTEKVGGFDDDVNSSGGEGDIDLGGVNDGKNHSESDTNDDRDGNISGVDNIAFKEEYAKKPVEEGEGAKVEYANI